MTPTDRQHAGNRLGFVLVHGGFHTASCWEPLIPHLELPAIAVDLPGRGRRPAHLPEVDIDRLVSSVVADIENSGFDQVVLCGHSMAGIVTPEVATRIPDRIAHLVFLTAAIPAKGKAIIDTVPAGLRYFIRLRLRSGIMRKPGPRCGRWLFCNDHDQAQAEFITGQLCHESAKAVLEPVSRARLPTAIPTTYVVHMRDRSLPVWNQRRQIENLGGCNVLALDAGHNAFVSQPSNVALLLNGIAAPLRLPQAGASQRSA